MILVGGFGLFDVCFRCLCNKLFGVDGLVGVLLDCF